MALAVMDWVDTVQPYSPEAFVVNKPMLWLQLLAACWYQPGWERLGYWQFYCVHARIAFSVAKAMDQMALPVSATGVT